MTTTPGCARQNRSHLFLGSIDGDEAKLAAVRIEKANNTLVFAQIDGQNDGVHVQAPVGLWGLKRWYVHATTPRGLLDSFGGWSNMATAPHKYFLACSTGKTDVVAAFLDGGVDPNARDKYKLTGLIWAGRKGRVEVAKLLLDRGASIDAEDATNRTAFFHAVIFSRYDFVKLLAKRGAKVSPVDMHETTPLDSARRNRDLEMVALLERLGAVGKETEADSPGVMTEISIGQESGGPDDGLMWPKVHLYKMLAKHCTRTYCRAIDQFSLVLRVSGKFGDFGPEAIERVRRRRQARYITADIVVPVQRWKGKTEKQLKKYLARQVRSGLEILVARLKKDKEQVDDVTLFADVEAGIAEFLRTRTPHKAWE